MNASTAHAGLGRLRKVVHVTLEQLNLGLSTSHLGPVILQQPEHSSRSSSAGGTWPTTEPSLYTATALLS